MPLDFRGMQFMRKTQNYSGLKLSRHIRTILAGFCAFLIQITQVWSLPCCIQAAAAPAGPAGKPGEVSQAAKQAVKKPPAVPADSVGGQDSVNRPVKDKWALIIGVSKFAKSSLNLNYADKDAQDFYSYLINEGQFARDHVKVLLNEQATQRRILSELGSKWLPRVAGPDDLVVVYVSSHGSPSERDIEGVNYLLAYDSDPDDLYATGIEMQQLAFIIKRRVHSNRVVLFLDACHSGSAKAAKGIQRKANVDAEKISQGTGQLVIASSTPDQVSWEFRDRPNSVFTRCLIDGLHRNGADTTLGEAFNFMKDKVQQIVLRERGELQSPVLKSAWKGSDLVIAVKPTSPHPGLTEAEENQYQEETAPSKPATPPVPTKPTVQVVPAQNQQVQTPVVVNVVPQPGYGQTSGPTGVSVIQSAKVESAPKVLPVKLSPKVAFLPFQDVDPAHASVEKSAALLWGHMSGVEEYRGLAAVVQTDLRGEAADFASDRIVAPEAVLNALNTLGLNPAGRLGPSELVRLGSALDCRYLVTGSIDEAHFHITTMANHYTLIGSMRVISGETGKLLKSAERLTVQKAPLTGDMGGGLKFFQKVVCRTMAERMAKELSKAVPSP